MWRGLVVTRKGTFFPFYAATFSITFINEEFSLLLQFNVKLQRRYRLSRQPLRNLLYEIVDYLG